MHSEKINRIEKSAMSVLFMQEKSGMYHLNVNFIYENCFIDREQGLNHQ